MAVSSVALLLLLIGCWCLPLSAATTSCAGTQSRWTLCRAADVLAAGLTGASLSVPHWVPPPTLHSACLSVAKPSTAFVSLLANGSYPGVTDPYIDDVLSRIGDISAAGSGHFTFFYVNTVTTNCSTAQVSNASHLLLRLAQICYRADVFVDGRAVAPLGVGTHDAVGMFTRFNFDGGVVGGPGVQAHGLAVLVSPPDHPGNASNACAGCGQGGNHELAQDVTSQYTAGWDWIGGTPDRNTGLFDDVAVEVTPSSVLMRDPIAVVTALGVVAADGTTAAGLNVTFSVSMLRLPGGSGNLTGTLSVAIDALNVTLTMLVVLPPPAPTLAGAEWLDYSFAPAMLPTVELWWPHSMGIPRLYDSVVSFSMGVTMGNSAENNFADPSPSTLLAWRVGFRTVESSVDVSLGGRDFRVNGHRVFLQGGNYIAVDQ